MDRLPASFMLRTMPTRRARPHAWMGVGQETDVSPLTSSLSPSDGERVPARAGEGWSARLPSFHGSGCVRLAGRAIKSLAGSKPFYWTLMAQVKIPLLLVLHSGTSFRSLIL